MLAKGIFEAERRGGGRLKSSMPFVRCMIGVIFAALISLNNEGFSRVINTSILNLLGTFLLQCGKVEDL